MSPPPGSLPWLSQRLDWTYLLFHAPSEGSVWEQRLWAKDTQLTCWSLTPPQSTVTQWDPLVPRGQGRSQPKMPERLCPGRVAHSPGDLGVQAKPHCQLAVCLGEFTMPLWSSITSSEKWVWLTLVLLSLLGGLIFSIRTRAPQCDKSGLIFRSNGRETVNAESLTYMIHIHRGPGAGDVFLTHPPWGGRLQVWGCGAGAGLKAQISPFKGICWASTHTAPVRKCEEILGLAGVDLRWPVLTLRSVHQGLHTLPVIMMGTRAPSLLHLTKEASKRENNLPKVT